MRPALLGALSLVLSGCLVSPDTPNCDFSDDCASCLTRSGCGWCPSRGCVEGTSLGADSYCADYRWDDCSVPIDPCAQYRDCDTCRMATACQWCASSAGGCSLNGQACATGVVGSCDVSIRCSDHDDCWSCVADGSCAWDEGTFVYCGECPGSPSWDGVCTDGTFCGP